MESMLMEQDSYTGKQHNNTEEEEYGLEVDTSVK